MRHPGDVKGLSLGNATGLLCHKAASNCRSRCVLRCGMDLHLSECSCVPAADLLLLFRLLPGKLVLLLFASNARYYDFCILCFLVVVFVWCWFGSFVLFSFLGFFPLRLGTHLWVCRFLSFCLFVGGGKDPVLNSFILCSGASLRKVRHACNL